MAVPASTTRRGLFAAVPALSLMAVPTIALCDTPIQRMHREIADLFVQCEAAKEDDEIDRIVDRIADLECNLIAAPIRSREDSLILLRLANDQEAGTVWRGVGGRETIAKAITWLEAH